MNSTHDFQTATPDVHGEPIIARVTGIKNIDSPLEALVFVEINKRVHEELYLDQLTPVDITEGGVFVLQLTGDEIVPTMPLQLRLENGKFVVDGKSSWHIVEHSHNRYKIQFGNDNKKLLTKLLFSDGEMDTVKIILVGTVPTDPEGGGHRTAIGLGNIQDVELTQALNASIVSFTTPVTPPGIASESILLDGQKPMPVNRVIESGQFFVISFMVNSAKKFLSVALMLQEEQVVLAFPQENWSVENGIFTYGRPGVHRVAFQVNLTLYPDSAMESQDIILVGTVPTLPDGGEKN